MGENSICGNGNYLYVEFFEVFVFFGDRRKFSRSDEGEVGRVKADNSPFSVKV
jgi:hypothetical protein